MQNKNYNMITLSINTGLNRVQIGTAGGYIKLLDAPTSANVLIHLNEQNADGIPLKAYHAIEATNIEKIYVSCNAVPGSTITIVQANSSTDFRMITPASDISLDNLGDFSDTAVSKIKFIPSGDGISRTILAGNLIELLTDTTKAIKFHSSQTTGVELNNNGVLFPMSGENEIFLRDINSIKFHNSLASDTVLNILFMGNILIDPYFENDYIVVDYIA